MRYRSIIAGSDGPRAIDDTASPILFVCTLLLVGVAALTCFGTRSLDDVAPTGSFGEMVIDVNGTTETVQSSDGCNTERCAAWRPYSRIDDGIGEVYWLIGNTNPPRACRVNKDQFSVALSWRGKQARCRWRSAR